tara:strand:+ start:583 stop:795 length:213 start_codon:yes stop_codon:yes gene_type:complete
MTLYNVSVTQYNTFYEIEADSEEEAKKIAIEDYIWDESDSSYRYSLEAELCEPIENELLSSYGAKWHDGL